MYEFLKLGNISNKIILESTSDSQKKKGLNR